MSELQQLRDEIAQLNTALTIKNGTIAQLKARNAQLEDRNAALAVQVEARQVPEGWKVDRRELDGAVCFTIGTPRKNGVRTNTSVFESDHDPAHLLLWHLLAAAPAQPAAQDQGEVQRLREALEWAVDRWHAEVASRPLVNVHRRALDDTWRQIIRRLGGDAGLLCGPAHDELLALAASTCQEPRP